MKKTNYRLRKAFGGLALGTFLFTNFGGPLFAKDFKNAHTQTRTLPKPQYQNSLGSFSVDFSGTAVSLNDLVSDLNGYFEADKNNSFKLEREYSDEFGTQYYNYQHFYKDVKIEGDMIFIQVKNNKIQFVSGQFVNATDLDTAPVISDEKVREIAYADFGTTENVHEGAVENLIVKTEMEEKVVLKFVKKINLTSVLPMKSYDFLIDGSTGKLLSSRNKVYKGDTPSTSTTYYRGNQNIVVDSYNGKFRLKDNNRKIRTLNGANLDGYIDPSDGTFTGYDEYINNTANYTSAASKPAIDVHWGIMKTFDYYKNVHNRNSFDGKGHAINNYYDAGELIGDSENAAAIDENMGGVEILGMVYGSGGPSMNPVVGLDVTGHEYSHLVIGRNGNGGLNYENESGALNESFADIFGTAIEFQVNLNPNWIIGENIMKSTVSPAYLRSMSDPNSGYNPQPDTYKGTYWQNTTTNPNEFNDYGGVHTNSGVGNFWFYLLSMGGYGTNDLKNQYWVEGIGIQKAEKIAYRALMSGLMPTATYMDAYNATRQAAVSLYGINSEEWNQVVNAWYAVGIGNAPAAVKNMEMLSKLNVYPNPAAGDEVFIDSELEDHVTVEMFDLSGKQLMAPKTLETRTSLNVAQLAAGMYILKFRSALGEYSHKLMVK